MPNQEELIQKTHDTVVELKIVLLGVKGTEDKGMAGTISDIGDHLATLNTRTGDNEVDIAKNSNSINWMRWIGAGLFTVLGAGTAIVLKILGLY